MKEPRTLAIVVLWPLDPEGGVNEVVKNLLRQFTTRTDLMFQPLVLELSWAHKQEDEAIPGVRRTYLRLHPVYLDERPLRSVLSYLLNLPRELIALSRLAKRESIAVFNLHFPDLQAFTFILLRMLNLFKGKVILSFHGSDIRAAHAQSRVSKLLWRFLLRHATSVVSCSDGLSEEILLLEPLCRVLTIHNGIDADRFAAEVDARFMVPAGFEGRRVITHVGSFDFGKGHDILIQAFDEVATRHSDVILLLAGRPGAMTRPVREMIENKGLKDRVHIFENLPHAQVCNLLLRSTVFAFASRWRKRELGEGFAIVILEAAAARLPVVATASCGVEEIVQNGRTGLVVPLEDAHALAEAILYMLDNPEEAMQMANNLHALVRHEFSWQEAAEQYSALYADAAVPKVTHDGPT